MKRSLFAVAALLGVLLIGLGTGSGIASAAGDPYATTSVVEVPAITVVRGARHQVTGAGSAPRARVTFTYDDGTVLGTTFADRAGAFRFRVRIPVRSTLGRHVITARCAAPAARRRVGRSVSGAAMTSLPAVDGQVTHTLAVDVVASAGGSALPRTGSAVTLPLLALGAAAVTLGGAFLIGSRRTGSA